MKFLLIVIVSLTYFVLNDSRLTSLHILQRHGVRAPISLYPTYPYFNQTSIIFPRGLGQLTEFGIKQIVNIGKYYRYRYQNFYPKDSRNAILQSSNVDRCIDSMAILSNQLWSPTLFSDWIAPRIYSAPQQLDTVDFYGSNCPNADLDFNSYLNGPEVAAFNQQNQWLYNVVGKQTGVSVDGLNGFINTLNVFDTLKSTKSNRIPIPIWAVYFYPQLSQILSRGFGFSFMPQNATRLRVGSLLREIRTRMDQALNSNITVDRWYKNFFIHSTHDLNIYGVLTALGNEQPNSPPFGAAIIFELHEIQNQNIVRVFYLNNTESLPISGVPLIIPSCGVLDCPYQTFISSISGFYPDIKTECGFPKSFDPIFILQQNLTNSGH